jgi:hypothetical protein
VKTFEELSRWESGARQLYVDPTIPVGLAFFRYIKSVDGYRGQELVFNVSSRRHLSLWLSPNYPVTITFDGPHSTIRGNKLISFGIEPIASGLWRLNPSLNLQGHIHVFVVLYGVPAPAPWADS